MVFYLKINRLQQSTLNYLQHWADVLNHFPEAKAFVVCDKPQLEEAARKTIKWGRDVEFIKSDRTSAEANRIIRHVCTPNWYNAGFAHLTTFSHAKANGFDRFYNIDADDLRLCLKPERAAELLKAVETYAVEHKIGAFSLDMWVTNFFGQYWSFGITYTDGSIDWIKLMLDHCADDGYLDLCTSSGIGINIDLYFAYLDLLDAAPIKTFYAENLRVVHLPVDDYLKAPIAGLRYWKRGRLYFPTLCNELALGESGSLPIASNVVKFDINLTEEEALQFLRSEVDLHEFRMFSDNKLEKKLSVIIYARDVKEYIPLCLRKLLWQSDQDFEIILIDDASDDGTLKLVRRMSEMFRGRMRIIQNETPRGLSESLNAGLRASSGKYVLLLDCADLLQPNFTQLFCDVAERMRADVLQTARHLSPPPDAKKYRNGMPLSLVKTIDVADNTAVLVPDGEQVRRGLWENVFKRNVGSVKLIRREFLFRNKIFFAGNDEESARAGFELQCLLRANRYGLIANYSHIHQQR